MSKSEEILSGQHSPAADARREYELSPDPIILENEEIEARFDRGSGALILLAYKPTGWMIQRRPNLGESFRGFVPAQARNYNPVLGAKNKLSSFELSENKTRLILCWDGWESEYAGRLDVSLRGVVELEKNLLTFSAEVINRSRYSIDSLSWPILGDIGIPAGETSLTRDNLELGTLRRTQLYPFMVNERGYWGTNFPTQINGRGNNVGLQIGGPNFFNRYVLISGTGQGVYLGTHETAPIEVVNYVFPSTLGYGKRVDAFRERYADYLWDAEFRDTRGAEVKAEGSPAILYSVFKQPALGRRAVIIVNDEPDASALVSVALEGGARALCWATPENPDLQAFEHPLTVPPRSACAVLEQ
jgi:hypothetical protein